MTSRRFLPCVLATQRRDYQMKGEAMTLNPKHSPVIFSLLCSGLVLFSTSFLYEWDVPFVYPPRQVEGIWGGGDPFPPTPTSSSLWTALGESIRLLRNHEMPFKWRDQQGNLLRLTLVLFAGAVLGRLLYWNLFERNRGRLPAI
jgi:hypothetical protein